MASNDEQQCTACGQREKVDVRDRGNTWVDGNVADGYQCSPKCYTHVAYRGRHAKKAR